MENNLLISVRNMNLFYGEKQALKDVSLDIYDKEIFALIGPSGCGKSTFLRSLNRMNDLISTCRIEGEIKYKGEDIYKKGYDVYRLREEVGMVFQKPNPFPMSIYENVAFAPKNQRVKGKEEVEKIVISSLKKASIYDEVGDRLKENALSLSGGQQQRLCIARALAAFPSLILMDEPTSALDPMSTAKIETLLLELKKEMSIVIVTHNMQQAARIADRTAFFLNGEVVEVGPTDKIFSTPDDKRTEDYVTGRFG